MRALLRFSVCCLLVALSAPSAFAADPVPTGKLPTTAAPLGYTLHFTIDPRRDRFSGETRIRVKLNAAGDHLWLHGEGLDVTRVELMDATGKRSRATWTVRDPSGVVEIGFGRTLQPQAIELAIDYTAPFNQQLEGLYKVTVGNDAYAVTQMEPVSARYAFPGFDEPRFKTPFDVSLTVPKDEVAVANTRQTGAKDSADGRWKTLTYARTEPLPTYLVAFAVGPWDVVDAPPIPPNDVRKTPVPLRGIGPRGSGVRLKWILGETPAIVKFYEDYTYQPYPFDKLDLLGAPDFAAGAMENAGLIVFRDALLLLDQHSQANLYRTSFNVTAHEIAHQWFGDLVTVPWWNDIWLNEAFATWAQAKATVALKPEYHGDLEALEEHLGAMASDSLLSTRIVRQPIRGRGDIETAFDGITYEKGANVLGMFEAWLGDAAFRKGIRAYVRQHRFGSGSADDLVATLAADSGKGETLVRAMTGFLNQPGVPLVHTELACRDGKAQIKLAQTRYLPFGVTEKRTPSWDVPVCARFGHAQGSTTQCFLLEKPAQAFAVDGACPSWYLPNANAAGYYRFGMADADLDKLGAVVAQLSPAEQVIYADAVSSAFRRGELAPGKVLDAMPALAGSDLPQVATALLDDFTWIREHLADARTRPALDAFAESLYAPRLQQLGFRRRAGEVSAVAALRVRLADFLAFTVRDPAVRKPLAGQGRAALGLDGSGKVDLTRADPDLLRAALKAAVQESGKPAFDVALGELGTNHATAQRYALLAALGSTRDSALGERARDYGLTPAVKLGEMRSLYGAQMGEPENRGAVWSWFRAHFDAVRTRTPAFAQGYLPARVAVGRCSKAEADELADFFQPRLGHLIGGERGLAQTLERIDQCAALRGHEGTSALSEWAAAHPPAH